MSIKEYNFTKMTAKDIFEMKLKDAIPEFGYISGKMRIPFIEFLVEHRFIQRSTEIVSDDKLYAHWMPLVDFRFSQMFGYGPKPVIMLRDQRAYTDRAKRLLNWID